MIRIPGALGIALALVFGSAVAPQSAYAASSDTPETSAHKSAAHARKGHVKRTGAGRMTGSQAGSAKAATDYPPTNSPSAPTGH